MTADKSLTLELLGEADKITMSIIGVTPAQFEELVPIVKSLVEWRKGPAKASRIETAEELMKATAEHLGVYWVNQLNMETNPLGELGFFATPDGRRSSYVCLRDAWGRGSFSTVIRAVCEELGLNFEKVEGTLE